MCFNFSRPPVCHHQWLRPQLVCRSLQRRAGLPGQGQPAAHRHHLEIVRFFFFSFLLLLSNFAEKVFICGTALPQTWCINDSSSAGLVGSFSNFLWNIWCSVFNFTFTPPGTKLFYYSVSVVLLLFMMVFILLRQTMVWNVEKK